jgi:polar amino acid transport system substrate-binding protein
MHKWFSTETRTQRTPSATRAGLRIAALGAFLLAGLCAPTSANAAAPAGCAALQAKYPSLKGKQLVNAINPHTPGYEAIDPKDPNKYVGFDIDLGEQIGECLGFTLTYKAVTFAALLTTLSSGQADIVISDIYATEERAKAADFITYSKVFDGVLVAKGNPKKITGINTSMCGAAAAENTGFVEVPLVQAMIAPCKAEGKPEPTLQLYEHRRSGGQGQSRQARKGDCSHYPLFGRHRGSQEQARIPRRRDGCADRGAEGRDSQGTAQEVGTRSEQLQRTRHSLR